MKRLASLLILVLCASSLISCSVQPPSDETLKPQFTEEPTQSQEETVLSEEETDTLEDEAPVTQENPEEDTASSEKPIDAPEDTQALSEESQNPSNDPPQQATPIQSGDISTKIEQIRAWYQDIVFDPNLETVTFTDAAVAYLRDNEIVSISEFHQLNTDFSPAMETVHFYYRNGEPFFVFIEYEHCQYEEVRLYFDDGQLIRWMIDQNTPNDNTPNAEWQAYYDDANEAYQLVQQLLRR